MSKNCPECKHILLKEVPENIYQILLNAKADALKLGNNLSLERVVYKLLKETVK